LDEDGLVAFGFYSKIALRNERLLHHGNRLKVKTWRPSETVVTVQLPSDDLQAFTARHVNVSWRQRKRT